MSTRINRPTLYAGTGGVPSRNHRQAVNLLIPACSANGQVLRSMLEHTCADLKLLSMRQL
jgi:hypothetical protein